MTRIAILGSTGSIGTSALSVVDTHPDRLEVVALAAGEQRRSSVPSRCASTVRSWRPWRSAGGAAALTSLRDVPVQIAGGAPRG